MSVVREQPRQEDRRPTAGDGALWAEASTSENAETFAAAWLTLLGRSQPSILQAVLCLPPQAGGSPVPVDWQVFRSVGQAPRATFEPACRRMLGELAEGKSPLVDFKELTGANVLAGWPVVIDGVLSGAVIVEAAVADEVSAKRLIRQLQWGSSWVEAYLARNHRRSALALERHARSIIDATRETVSQPRFAGACAALASQIARDFACHRVAIGLRHGTESRIVSLSQSAAFDGRSELARQISAAMDEAIDQQRTLCAPDAGGQLAPAQQALLATASGRGVLTVPLSYGDRVFGAVTLERVEPAAPFAAAEIELAEAVCAVAGPVLDEKHRLDMSLPRLAAVRARDFIVEAAGPKRLKSALWLAAAAALVLLVFAKGEYRVTAKVQVQGELRRVVGAPFDGFIKSQFARAGEIVREGALLAQLEDNDLNLERLRQAARLRQYELELERALAKRDIAAVSIAQAQIEQTMAESDLAAQMLERTRIKAPFDSVVVSGDLSQSVGRPVSRGDVLFELAPLDRYRVTALVPDADMQFMKTGLTGSMRLAGLPEQSFDFDIATITPVARVADGVNGFEVIGPLKGPDPRVRPGMEGVAKIPVGRHNLVWIWTHELMAWLRVKLWAWIP